MRLLDLFCGAGGASVGYHWAGFDEILGIDIVNQPRYPFTFVKGDALRPPVRLEDFDLIHASPPCQAYSKIRTLHPRKRHPRLIEPTRALLAASGVPSILENVEGSGLTVAPSLFGGFGAVLCGTAFGLQATIAGQRFELQRHRLFETTFPVPPLGCNHRLPVVGVYGHGSTKHERERRGFNVSTASVRREVMEMPWASRDEIAEAIPPAYTEHIGRQFLDQIARGVA